MIVFSERRGIEWGSVVNSRVGAWFAPVIAAGATAEHV